MKRIPRKLKKKVKKACWCHWEGNSNAIRMAYAISVLNPVWHREIINRTIGYE